MRSNPTQGDIIKRFCCSNWIIAVSMCVTIWFWTLSVHSPFGMSSSELKSEGRRRRLRKKDRKIISVIASVALVFALSWLEARKVSNRDQEIPFSLIHLCSRDKTIIYHQPILIKFAWFKWLLGEQLIHRDFIAVTLGTKKKLKRPKQKLSRQFGD